MHPPFPSLISNLLQRSQFKHQVTILMALSLECEGLSSIGETFFEMLYSQNHLINT